LCNLSNDNAIPLSQIAEELIMTTLTTQNETWGFFGTMASAEKNAQAEWTKAFAFIKSLKAMVHGKAVSDEEIRGFLDAKAGRHLADAVVNMGSIEKVHAKWAINSKGFWFFDTIAAFRVEAW
jgi:hypothetical protein